MTGIERALAWLDTFEGRPYLSLRRGNSKQVCFSYEVEGASQEEAVEEFRRQVKLLYPGAYTLAAKRNKNGGAGQLEFAFRIEGDSPNAQLQQVPVPVQVQAPDPPEIDKLVEDAVSKRMEVFLLQQQVKEKEKEIAELKEQQTGKLPSYWETAIHILGERYLPKLIGGDPTTESTAIAGANEEGLEEEVEETELGDAFENVLDKLGEDRTLMALKKIEQLDEGTIEMLLGQ